MKFIIGVICILILGACTTFTTNESGLRRACKSGVSEYDDGNMNFKCKEDNGSASSSQREHNRAERVTK